METINTIIPIFAVIFLGLFAKKRGLIPTPFLGPANQLTYYLAIPALVFRAIAKSDFHSQFDIRLVAGTLVPLFIVYIAFWIFCIVVRMPKKHRGTFIESTVHGNIGYIGLAVVFYYLGSDALATAGILAGFVMLTHNAMAVVVLQVNSDNNGSHGGLVTIVLKIIRNPIIFTAAFSIGFSLLEIPIPVIVDRTLSIIGNLALPLALLLIGASLSIKIKARQLIMVGLVCLAKLMILPAVGLWGYLWLGLDSKLFMPGLIILTTPVATVSYILATEMKGDPELAVNIISVSTALSGFTILFWLAFVGSL